MNRNNLKRILNKLTAVADVELFQGKSPTSNITLMYGDDPGSLSPDYCKLLKEYNFFHEMINLFTLNGATIPMSSGPASRIFLTALLQKFMVFMFLFCECKKKRGIRLNSTQPASFSAEEDEVIGALVDHYFNGPTEELLSVPDGGPTFLNISPQKLKKMKSALRKMFLKCQIYLKTLLTDPSNRSCDQFDFEMHVWPIEADVEAFRPFIPPALIDELTYSFESLSPVDDPGVNAPCVTVPVEQIETAFSNIPSIVTMGLVAAGVLGVAFWIRRGNFTKAMAAASAIAVTSGASAAEIQALQNALRGIAGPVMQQAANGQTFCPEPGTAGTSSGG